MDTILEVLGDFFVNEEECNKLAEQIINYIGNRPLTTISPQALERILKNNAKIFYQKYFVKTLEPGKKYMDSYSNVLSFKNIHEDLTFYTEHFYGCINITECYQDFVYLSYFSIRPLVSISFPNNIKLIPSLKNKEIAEPYGKGTYGKIYLAQSSEQKKYTVKIGLKIDLIRDIEILSKIQNIQNVCKIHNATDLDEYTAIIMDKYNTNIVQYFYCQKHVLDKEINFIDYLNCFIDILETINVLHNYGIYHCDIKTDNILFDNNTKKPVLIDFGLAEEIGDSKYISSNQEVVTLYWKNPNLVKENITSHQNTINSMTDIWAAFIVFLEIVGTSGVNKVKVFSHEYKSKRELYNFYINMKNVGLKKFIQNSFEFVEGSPLTLKIIDLLTYYMDIQKSLEGITFSSQEVLQSFKNCLEYNDVVIVEL